jgi:Zn-dependent protease
MSFHISEWIIRIAVLLFAITIHEYAHGKAALSLGDPTAKKAGRLTLNPISHIDPIGAICLFFFHFGWAKPVPVDTRYFQNRRRDTVLMALSGPVSNISAAFVAGLFFRFYNLQIPIYHAILTYMIIMNTGLGIFNLLPIPPLDGSHILENLLPVRASEKYRKIKRYAPFILIGVLLMDRFLHTGIISSVLWYPIASLTNLITGQKLFPT